MASMLDIYDMRYLQKNLKQSLGDFSLEMLATMMMVISSNKFASLLLDNRSLFQNVFTQ